MEAPASLTSSDSSNSGNSYVFESDLSSDASDYEEIPEVGHFVFDPLATSSSDDDDESVAEDDGDVVRDDAEEADNAQWHGLEWCGCGLCEVMGTATENLCCHSIQKVREKIPTSEICITVHPTFLGDVLNHHAIEIAYFNLMEHEREAINAPDLHRTVSNNRSM
ncbi:uncharacterized protein ISCGN_002354 [Ixodes scapularis]